KRTIIDAMADSMDFFLRQILSRSLVNPVGDTLRDQEELVVSAAEELGERGPRSVLAKQPWQLCGKRSQIYQLPMLDRSVRFWTSLQLARNSPNLSIRTCSHQSEVRTKTNSLPGRNRASEKHCQKSLWWTNHLIPRRKRKKNAAYCTE